MIRFVADENFNRAVVLGVRQREPVIDIALAQDAPGVGTPDPALLAWAAAEGRLVLSHDLRTMRAFAFERVDRGQPMPGVLLVAQDVPRAVVIDDILAVAFCSEPDEWADQVRFLPLR